MYPLNPNSRWARYMRRRAVLLDLPPSATYEQIMACEAELARDRAKQGNPDRKAEPVRESPRIIESKPQKPKRRQRN